MNSILAIMVISLFGCKPIAHSGAEDKSLSRAGKAIVDEVLTKTQKLAKSRTVENAIRRAVSDGELDDLKKLIKKGDELADAASLAYYQELERKQRVWAGAMNRFRNSILFEDEVRGSVLKDIEHLNQIATRTAEEVRKYSSKLETTALQIDEIVRSVDGNKFDTAFDLCCREAILPKDTPVEKTGEFLSEAIGTTKSNRVAEAGIWESEIPIIIHRRIRKFEGETLWNISPKAFNDAINKLRLKVSDLELASKDLDAVERDFRKILVDSIK